MNTFIFTFGGYHSKFAHKCVRIKAITAEEARKKIEQTNIDYYNQYSEEEWKKRIEQSQRVSQPIEQEISMEDILQTLSKL